MWLGRLATGYALRKIVNPLARGYRSREHP